jgi:hypothetical protein
MFFLLKILVRVFSLAFFFVTCCFLIYVKRIAVPRLFLYLRMVSQCLDDLRVLDPVNDGALPLADVLFQAGPGVCMAGIVGERALTAPGMLRPAPRRPRCWKGLAANRFFGSVSDVIHE